MLTINQFVSVLEGLHMTTEGVNLYGQDEMHNLIDEGVIGIYVKVITTLILPTFL